ncbi:MAG: NDP-sugar synthase [Vicinamibacterales bacterium]|jgi:NDP-sugar pyrophosphorylase family protein|nr:NDP-sugar synthase [Vicinamibacterales bacterium]
MKAVILAGGFGTRLRPLTLDLPKPIVPIFDRPFLYYQIDLLRQVPEIDEVILSLNYQPDRIAARVGDGTEAGVPLRYMVEPEPLGTGGAIKYASAGVDDTVLVFNGDVLTGIDLQAVVRRHHERDARATIVLTPVDNPSAYGLVETDGDGNIRRFLEKPRPDQITCDTINAGIYVLEPDTFDRIPDDTKWSIERQYFPSLVERAETFVAYVDRGYWLDIGTPASYVRAHRDLMAQRCAAGPFAGRPPGTVHRGAGCQVADGAVIDGPCFLGDGCVVEDGARVGPESVLGPGCTIAAGAVVERSIVWRDTVVDRQAAVHDAVLGEHCHIEHHAEVGPGVILGNRSTLTAHTKAHGASG